MLIYRSIRFLKTTALLLFIVPFIGLIGSLLFHNYLVSFNYTYDIIIPYKNIKPGSTFEQVCTKENDWCDNLKVYSKLDQCNKFLSTVTYSAIDKTAELNVDYQTLRRAGIVDGKSFMVKFQLTNQLDKTCILNSKTFFLYKIFPIYFESLAKNKNSFSLGTSKTVNPLFYGETSISNIVKRYPVKFVFKPLMFLSVILMILYWFFYNKVLNNIFQVKGANTFLIFGVLSAIFLFLHVYFLGQKYEAEILNQIRRSYIVFFILFEIFAQAYLLKIIWKKRNDLKDYFYQRILISKLSFVIFVAVSSFIILIILIFKNLSAKVDYILEWNYFLILLFYYLLSFLIWKKSLFRDPSSA